MARFGYTLMTELSGPIALVDYACAAKRIDFEATLPPISAWMSVGDRYQREFLEQAAEPLLSRLRSLPPRKQAA